LAQGGKDRLHRRPVGLVATRVREGEAAEVGERDDEQPRVERSERTEEGRLVQLHQMLVALESGQMPQEDEHHRLWVLRETDYPTIRSGQ
jgi:hypothetical protein